MKAWPATSLLPHESRINYGCDFLRREANTFSIIARCPRSGQLGVAVASAVPAVGSMCPFVLSGIGAVSTQSWVNPYLALTALAELERGAGATDALSTALAGDEAGALRQLGLVDGSGTSAAHTGTECTPWAGQILGMGVAIIGNMLSGPEVLGTMAAAFDDSKSKDLTARLMLTLEAGDAAGGDKRGKQSAALRVHTDEVYPLIDIRVDEHAEPISELRRVLRIARAQLMPLHRRDAKARQPRRAGPTGGNANATAIAPGSAGRRREPKAVRDNGGGSDERVGDAC